MRKAAMVVVLLLIRVIQIQKLIEILLLILLLLHLSRDIPPIQTDGLDLALLIHRSFCLPNRATMVQEPLLSMTLLRIFLSTPGVKTTPTAKSALSRLEDSIGIEGYTAVGDNWFVYSYEINGEVVYLKEYVGAGSIVGMSITYPRSMSSEGDRMVEIMEPTLEPGDISSTH